MKKCILLFILCSFFGYAQSAKNPYPIIFVHGLNSNHEIWGPIAAEFGGSNKTFHVCLNHDGDNTKASLDSDIFYVGWSGSTHENRMYAINFDNTKFPVVGHENHILSNQAAIVKQGKALAEVIRQVLALENTDKVILVGHSMGGLAIREYLQRTENGIHKWWVGSDPNAGHHVAKVVTVGTPHQGSNSSLGLLSWIVDEKNDAVRDLRYTYSDALGSKYPSPYLYGGSEMIFENYSNVRYYNFDTNCDGYPSDSVLGLNSEVNPATFNENMKLPLDIAYTWITSLIPNGPQILAEDDKDGDGVVKTKRQWLNDGNNPPSATPLGITDTLFTNKIHANNSLLKTFCSYSGSSETEDINVLTRGLDEPAAKELAYHIKVGQSVQGRITYGMNYSPNDDDAFVITSTGYENISVTIVSNNAPLTWFAISDEQGNNIDYRDCTKGTGTNTITISNVTPQNNYYIWVSGSATSDSYLNPYTVSSSIQGLSSPNISPNSGKVSDKFGFTVTYKSTLSVVPDFVKLFVDGSPFPMTSQSTDWVNGVDYSCFAFFTAGQHSYHFEATANGITFRSPVNGELNFNVSNPTLGPLALSLVPNPVNISSQVTASVHTSKPNYPIGFYANPTSADYGIFLSPNPIYTDNNGNASIIYQAGTTTGNVTITAMDWIDHSNFDQKVLQIVKPAHTLNISLSPQRKSPINGTIQYAINYTVTQNSQPYYNFNATFNTDFGVWTDNNSQTYTFDSQGNYIGSKTLICNNDGVAHITLEIEGNIASLTVPIQLNPPAFTPYKTLSTPGITSLSLSPNDDKIAYTSNDFYLRKYDISDDAFVSSFGPYDTPGSIGSANMDLNKIRYSPDGTKIFIMGRGGRIINASDGTTISENRNLMIGSPDQGDAQWIDNSNIIIAYRYAGVSTDCRVSKYNTSLSLISTILTQKFTNAKISALSNYVVISLTNIDATNNSTSYVYNKNNLSLIGSFSPTSNGGKHYANAISPNGANIAIYNSRYQLIHLLNSSNLAELSTIPTSNMDVYHLTYNPVQTNYFAALSYSNIVLWNASNSLQEKVDASNGITLGLEGNWLSDGEVLVVGGGTGLSSGTNLLFYAPFDIGPPSITISSHPDNFNTYLSSIQVSGSASDDKSVASVRYQVNGGSWNSLTLTNGNFLVQVALIVGLNTIQFEAKDNVGKKTYKTISATRIDVPAVTSLLAPNNHSVNLPIVDTLKWSKVQNATLYKIQIATDSLFTSLVLNDANVPDTIRIVTGLLNNTKYFWRVQSINPAGSSNYSDCFNFITIVPFPNAPTLYSPGDNQVNVLNYGILKWFREPNTTGYHLEISEDNLFTSAVIIDTVLTDTLYHFDKLKLFTKYFWRVKSFNIAGTSINSNVFSFKTVSSLLSVPSLLTFPNTINNDSSNLILPIVTLSNNDLIINSFTRNTSIFQTNTSMPVVVRPNETLNTKIIFTPNSFGQYADTLVITSDGGSAKVALIGTSPYPVLVSSSSELSYGAVARNSIKKWEVKITNTSINKLIVDSIYTKTSMFTVDKNNGNVGTDTLSLDVMFNPTIIGEFTDTLYLRNNSETTLVKIPLRGTTPTPVLVAEKYVLNFPNTAKGDSSKLFLTIKNSSLSPLSISTINLGTTFFNYEQATPIHVNGDDSLQITVQFKPTDLGTVTDTLKITSDGGDASVILTGTSPYPVFVSSSTSLSYGAVARNSTKIMTVKVTNTSINQLNIDSIYTKTSTFIVDKVKGSIALDTLALSIMFNPTVTGVFTDTLYLQNNSETYLIKIPLSGSTPTPVLVTQQHVLNFPNTAIHDSSSLFLSIINSSLSPLSLNEFKLGTDFFSIEHATSVLINGDDSLQLKIRFTPSFLGTVTDTLNITSDGGDASVVLTGTSPYPVLVSSSSELSYGAVARNSIKKWGVKITNTSINKLIVDSIYTKTSMFTVNTNNGSVGTDTLSLDVMFNPTEVGTFSDTLYLQNNSATTLVKIPLSGSTPSPQIVTGLNSVFFGPTILNDSARSNLVIRNTSITEAKIGTLAVGNFFIIQNDSVTTIAGMDSTTLKLVYNPLTYGIHSDTIKIESDGGNLAVPVKGVSPYPELLLPQSELSFGSVGVYDSLKIYLDIKNSSINTLNIDSVYTKSLYFTTLLQKSNVAQFDSSKLTITFSSSTYGSFVDTIYFKSNAEVTLSKLSLSAFVPYPYLSVSKSVIDFGEVIKDSLKQSTIVVKDTSISRLNIDSILTSTKYFVSSMSSPSPILTNKDSAIVLIEFRPDTIKQFIDTLFIFNSSQVNPFKIALLANGIVSGIQTDADLIPDHYSLSQNYPNPFNPTTVIRFGLPFDSKVIINVYNILGQEVKLLKDDIITAGNHEVQFNTTNLSSGVYIYRLSAESINGEQKYSSNKKMILLK